MNKSPWYFLRQLSLSLKFIVVISFCLFIVMTISIWYLEGVQVKAFEQEAHERSEIVANFGEANRKFVSENLRPVVEKYTKDFVLEAMSATFSTRTIFQYFNKIMPEYLYQQPTLNPLNPLDQSDEFDSQIIHRFQNDRTLKKITGYRFFNNQENFYIAKPIHVESSCLKCHWNPETAPASLVKKYGSTHGYGWKVGDIVSTLMIYVPTQDLRAHQVALTRTVVVTFVCLFVILIMLIYLFFDRLVNQRLQNMIRVMEQVSLIPKLNSRLPDSSRDELGVLARTFNRMANSLEFAYSDLEQKVAERTAELQQTMQQLQQTQVQIIQAEKMSSLGQMVAGVAHEINNPVNFIYANLTYVDQYTQDLLRLLNAYRQNYPQPPQSLQAEMKAVDMDFLIKDLPKILQSMKVGSDHIQEIVLSLRNFSRSDETGLKLVNLHEGIDNTLMILQHRFKANAERPAIQVVKQYGDLPLIECFPGQLNQVFMNLLANAIDALEESNRGRSFQNIVDHPNRIWINTANPIPDQVQITITDNGSGIPENICLRIFDPFFTTKAVGKGTGLGLSISYQVVNQKHNGKLWCDSTFGTGTKFVIELPISGEDTQ